MSEFLNVFQYGWKHKFYLSTSILAASLLRQLKQQKSVLEHQDIMACLSVSRKFCEDRSIRGYPGEYQIVMNCSFLPDKLLLFFLPLITEKRFEHCLYCLFEEIYTTDLYYRDRRVILAALLLLVKFGKKLKFYRRRKVSNFLSLMTIIARQMGFIKIDSSVLRYYINLKEKNL